MKMNWMSGRTERPFMPQRACKLLWAGGNMVLRYLSTHRPSSRNGVGAKPSPGAMYTYFHDILKFSRALVFVIGEDEYEALKMIRKALMEATGRLEERLSDLWDEGKWADFSKHGMELREVTIELFETGAHICEKQTIRKLNFGMAAEDSATVMIILAAAHYRTNFSRFFWAVSRSNTRTMKEMLFDGPGSVDFWNRRQELIELCTMTLRRIQDSKRHQYKARTISRALSREAVPLTRSMRSGTTQAKLPLFFRVAGIGCSELD